jgi:hypothetical protein
VTDLRLEVRDFEDLTRWRWELTNGAGKSLASHDVRLEAACWQHEAFTGLLGYLRWHAAPDQQAEDEARTVAEVGAWMGQFVLGPVAGALAAARHPATVRVVVPPQARALLFCPLELAHVNGRPLAVQDITLVMQPAGDKTDGDAGSNADNDGAGAGDEAEPVGQRLRVLGLFSLPEGGQPLNLRRERHSLVQLIGGIAAAGKAADVRVLQYGVTRDRLQDVLEEAEGWDIIHISGHGAPGELILEDAAGRPDQVTAADLADMLDVASERVKLVTVAACWSAALTAAEQRRLLGLPVPDPRAGAPGGDFGAGALATELAGKLGCAVLAMRYPVDDDFAIALTVRLYDLLARQGQTLPRAVGLALRRLATEGPWPALSVATPALFGGRAIGLRLAAPDRTLPEPFNAAAQKMAGFPPQPARFVGRTGVMARASAVLAAESGIPGVLLHGMPGGGKTACALELAYTHEHAFPALIWYKAPDEGTDIRGALTDFALTLERQVTGFQMAHLLADPDKLTAFLPVLTELVEQRRVLIVIDNIESLLTEHGQWRDERWGQVIGALCAHSGRGRLVLTSRRLPADTCSLRVQPVDALSLDEALLLARELPHLNRLIRGDLPGVDRDVSRRLALGVLNVAQGHPKLLELADGQAADPVRLAALVEAGDQAWRAAGGLPSGFFATGHATAHPADYLHVLAAWTTAVAGTLVPGERALFWFLCCLEEPDRDRQVLDGTWADLWNRLGRDGNGADLRERLGLDGPPPDLDAALKAIAAQGLAAIQGEPASYAIHPGVAAAGRAQAGKPFRDAADNETAAYWDAVFRSASGETGGTDAHTGTDTRLMVRAGLAAVPYLLRQEQWTTAAYLLERAFTAEPSRANAAAVLPAIQEIAARDPRYAGVAARVLQVIDPAAAETQLRTYLDAAAARGDYRWASAAAGQLMDLCRDSGRLAEALALAGRKAGYTRQAGLGPWTQLADQVQRLQVLNAMGQAGEVLDEVQRLRGHLQTLPATRGPDETATPWNVREVLLDTGSEAARHLGRWDDALDLNAAQTASMRDRRAPATDIARAWFNDYYPLLRLGRTGEALGLLLECRQVFQDARDTAMLGNVLSALADTEDARGHGDAAIRMARDALRYTYLAGDVLAIAVSYHNLGNYLRRHARQPAPALACHLASALICALTGADDGGQSVRAAATDLRELGAADTPPADVAGLCRQAGDIPGTDLGRLLTALAPDPAVAEQALQRLVAQAQAEAAEPPPEQE